ncbi:hypothetical protein K2173_019035 [Erythroxylum novogranatense]|uniref:Leucine-rich repeat-containing N-terminal plant-type domain-containing protein n=1 Tax=Erythroxylum novogranatense TaxID=1862640 RepID=A0AAV8SSI7_9ROSI|nr:hypothetical protein K2173_019035 [Erythroxylum novogranatense]
MARQLPFQLAFVLYSIILTTLLAYAPTLVQSSTLESDIQVLRLVQQSIDPVSIPASSYLNSWDFSLDPCESSGGFLGVLCTFPLDNSSNRVIEIDLDAAGYDGFLSPAIGNLSELTTLNLSKNKFRGPIPDTIVNLKRLTRISLSGNLFTGNIPYGITRLKHLEFIDLSQNHLSGSIPPDISGLRSLTYLSLSSNSLSGRIPDLSGLWQLGTLDLQDNQLYGILPKLPVNLRTLSLSHNVLSGHISPIRVLQRLAWLDVSDNRLTGIISQEILTLPQALRINLSINHFSVIEPIKYPARETQLQVLDAHANQLSGHLPVGLAAVENLTSIYLSHNQLYGPIPPEYGTRLSNSWKALFLDNNFLIGNLPRQFNNVVGIRGSLAHNCLRCPSEIPLCRGGQRSPSECGRSNDESD